MYEDITLKELSVTFRPEEMEIKALKSVSANFRKGRITGLIGESGSGKSVLGMSLLRLNPTYAFTSGQIFYKERDILLLSEEEMRAMRKNEFGLIPQNPSLALNPYCRIGGQLHECFEDDDNYMKSDQYLRTLGFNDEKKIRNSYSFEMSGGMNQRIVSIFGMANAPTWIIADEPTKGLDSILRKQVAHILRTLQSTENKPGILLITHDIPLARALCDDVIILYNGEIAEEGTVEILSKPTHEYSRLLISAVPGGGFVTDDEIS